MMERAAHQNNWGFIHNSNINEWQHVGQDGVHLYADVAADKTRVHLKSSRNRGDHKFNAE